MSIKPQNLRVYLVEDDEDLREEILETLIDTGFQAHAFEDSAGLYAALAQQACDILILDVGLPGESGFQILEHLGDHRQHMGVIMLTAHGDTKDQVLGLSLGADTYLVKPTDLEIIEASIISLARRLLSSPPRQAQTEQPSGWQLVAEGWILQAPCGTETPLTPQERSFLQRLFQDSGNPVGRDEILKALGVDVFDGDYHRLDALSSRLRKKAADKSLNLPLRAVRGQGYIFDPRGQE
jgi:DNA-binding response OmpR family regulator